MLDRVKSLSTPRRWWIASVLWLAVPVLGFAALNLYSATPGAIGAMSAGHASLAGARLLMFLHPKCPCSAASVTELAEIAARGEDPPAMEIVFVAPRGVEAGWELTKLHRRASAIPGAKVSTDVGGTKAQEFGALTSGFVVLLDAGGRPLFRGGITRARGHQGDSPGRRALLALLAGETPDQTTAPVYGCPLMNAD